MNGEEAESSIRFSLGFGTTDADLEEAVRLITEALMRLARAGLCAGAESTHPAADAAPLPRGDEDIG